MRSPLGSLRAKAPVAYAGRAAVLPWTGLARPQTQEAQMRAMGSVGTLYAILDRTTSAVASARWRLWKTARSGLDEDRTEVTRHLALDIWNRPNPFMDQALFVETFSQHLDLVGEGWLLIVGNPVAKALPAELWPVVPFRMLPLPHPTEFLSGYEYHGPDGEVVELGVTEVVRLIKPHPLDPYRGMGAVQTILADLDATKYSAEWNRNFFINSAEPGGIVEYERRLSDEEFNEVTARWREQHRGVANAHRVAIIEQGKWVDRKYSMRDMEFNALRAASREIIMEAFGFPKAMLGVVTDVNRANAEANETMFARWLVTPRLERIKRALNSQFLPRFGGAATGLEFDFDTVIPEDREADDRELTSKATAAQQLIGSGGYGPSVLEALGLPEIVFTPTPTPAPAGPAPALAPGTPAGPPAPAVPPPAARLALPAGTTALEQVRVDYDSALGRLLHAWAPVLEDQITALEHQVEQALEHDDVAALAAIHASPDDAERVLRDALADMADVAASRIAEEASAQGVTVTPPKVDPAVRAGDRVTVVAFGAELGAIAATVAALLAAEMAAAAAAEALRLFTPGAAAKTISRAVGRFLRGRSDRSRRERLGAALHRATNTGRIGTLRVAPNARYYADEVNDANRCEPCSMIDGHEFGSVDAADAVYGGGGYPACLGGDRCRGTVRAVWEG